MSKKVGDIYRDTKLFDYEHGVDNPPTLTNLSYLGLCITGEAGEFANIIKKIIRGGGNQGASQTELLQRGIAELVDIGIYFCEAVDYFEQAGYNFDKEWEKKFNELQERPFWQARRKRYNG